MRQFFLFHFVFQSNIHAWSCSSPFINVRTDIEQCHQGYETLFFARLKLCYDVRPIIILVFWCFSELLDYLHL